jgi:drug efflux transport system ATP-binding protein
MFDAPIIDVQGLTKRYGSHLAVNNISFSVGRGEVFAFIGPNGSGKSTTVRMLCGILKPSSGLARVLGFDVATQAERIKQQIGYMSQKFSLYNDLPVLENLEFYAGIYDVPRSIRRARIEELIEMAGLAGRQNQRVGQLSGGWKQRLALACALVHRPALLFLDEPTAGVDPVSRRRFFAMIFSLVREGVTIFLTTHYLDEAEYANRIGIIQNGELRALASPREIRRTALQGRLLNVICDFPVDAVELVRRAPGVYEAVLYGSTIHALVDPARQSADELIDWLGNNQVEVHSVSPIEPSLEDVFISLSSGFHLSDDGRHVDLEAQRLRQIPLLADLDERLLTAIANRCVTEHHPTDQVLFEQDEPGDRLYIIVRGEVAVLRREASGATHAVASLRDGDFFGEIALLRQVPRTATLRTRTDCVLLTLGRAEFLDLLDAAPGVRRLLEDIASSRLAANA